MPEWASFLLMVCVRLFLFQSFLSHFAVLSLLLSAFLEACSKLPRRSKPKKLATNFADQSVGRDTALKSLLDRLLERASIVAKSSAEKEPPVRLDLLGLYGSPGSGKSHFIDQCMNLEFLKFLNESDTNRQEDLLTMLGGNKFASILPLSITFNDFMANTTLKFEKEPGSAAALRILFRFLLFSFLSTLSPPFKLSLFVFFFSQRLLRYFEFPVDELSWEPFCAELERIYDFSDLNTKRALRSIVDHFSSSSSLPPSTPVFVLLGVDEVAKHPHYEACTQLLCQLQDGLQHGVPFLVQCLFSSLNSTKLREVTGSRNIKACLNFFLLPASCSFPSHYLFFCVCVVSQWIQLPALSIPESESLLQSSLSSESERLLIAECNGHPRIIEILADVIEDLVCSLDPIAVLIPRY
jgi:hypothetical protein